MPRLAAIAATFGLVASTFGSLAVPAGLVGTWSTKSNATLTGPGFFNPVSDKLIEPNLTGISYSFTSDGHYEEAYYRAISNPTNPACPSGIMQWQHGTFVLNANGSISLTPIDVDGRQLLSEPCDSDTSIYTRYNQSEYFESYGLLTDPYHNIPRLNLYEFDGTPMQPLYLRYTPPEMLPTTTLNPTSTTATSTATAKAKAKRGLDKEAMAWMTPLHQPETIHLVQRIDTQRLWWIGIGMTGIGGLLYLGPRRLGIRL